MRHFKKFVCGGIPPLNIKSMPDVRNAKTEGNVLGFLNVTWTGGVAPFTGRVYDGTKATGTLINTVSLSATRTGDIYFYADRAYHGKLCSFYIEDSAGQSILVGQISILVIWMGDVIVTPDTSFHTDGTNCTLTCTIAGGVNPAPSYSWQYTELYSGNSGGFWGNSPQAVTGQGHYPEYYDFTCYVTNGYYSKSGAARVYWFT